MTPNHFEGLVTAWLEGFTFNRPGKAGSLGEDVISTAVDVMADRAAQSRGPDKQWDENEPEYAKRKGKKYGTTKPNVRTGQMTSKPSLRGRSKVEPHVVTMIYGTGEPPTSAANGAELTKTDRTTTDVEKAHYAHTGQSKRNVKRPLYGPDQDMADKVGAVIREGMNDHVRDWNSR